MNLRNRKVWKLLFLICFIAPLIGNVHKVVVRAIVFVIWVIFGNNKFVLRFKRSRYIGWSLAFVIFCLVSSFWALDRDLSLVVCEYMISNLLLSIVIINYVNCNERLFDVIDAFLASELITLLVCLSTSTISQWGTGYFASGILLHRNEVSMNAAMALAMVLYAKYFTKKAKYSIYFWLILALAILPASRNAFVATSLVLSLFKIFTSKDVGALFKRVFLILIVGVGVILLLYSIPILRENYLDRLVAVVKFFGENTVDIEDGSALERRFFWEVAIYMFKNKPLFGWGINNFRGYLESIHYSNAVYAHSDYAELMADVGVVGLILYYVPFISALWNSIIMAVNKRKVEILSFILLLVLMIASIGIISYYKASYSAIYTIMFAVYERSQCESSDVLFIKIRMLNRGSHHNGIRNG